MAKANRNVFPANPKTNVTPIVNPAPAPTKGNARIIYQYLLKYGPLTEQTLEASCISHPHIKTHKLDKATTIKQSIYNMAYNGIIHVDEGLPGRAILCIASIRNHELRQETLEQVAALKAAKKEDVVRDKALAAAFAHFDAVEAKRQHRDKTAIAAIVATVIVLGTLMYALGIG